MRIFDSSSFTVDLSESEDCFQELTVRGQALCVWPNREGEGFMLDAVAPALVRNGCRESGISLSWPATASSRSLILKSDDVSILISKKNDSPGYHEEIRIYSDSLEIIRFRFTGPPGRFEVTELNGSTDSPGFSGYPGTGYKYNTDLNSIPKQFQIGLIGSEGECEVPEKEGFKALIPLGQKILNAFPAQNTKPVIHLFGYGAGHDRGYPDYSPSKKLGGEALFKETLAGLKELGFTISLYMNARLMDVSIIKNYPQLEKSILNDSHKKPFMEQYFGRDFHVMNPDSKAWQDELFSQASKLGELGADMIQLDQVAGRAAPVSTGSPWGEGYVNLIRRIQNIGMKVWIQGVSDYYPADCFEMTWKDLEILENGILRGGNPFGAADLSLLHCLRERGEFKGTLLAPIDKKDIINSSLFDFNLVMMDKRGLLPLFGPDYLKRVIKLGSL